jgi:hypothetical protein
VDALLIAASLATCNQRGVAMFDASPQLNPVQYEQKTASQTLYHI